MIKHMAVKRSDLEKIASQSLVNCHAVGLDSVMFDNTPGARVRAFVTQENHTLYLNDGRNYRLGLALHPHHCDLTMTHIQGPVVNMEPHWVRRVNGRRYDAFVYHSQILEGKGGFERVGTSAYVQWLAASLHIWGKIEMKATDLHTVYVPRHRRSAWFIHEHKENPKYKPVCWSDRNLETEDFSQLYKPMSVERLVSILNYIGMSIEGD